MSNLIAHAKTELALLRKADSTGSPSDDGFDKMLEEGLLEIIGIFANQGHSGFSASWFTGILTKLMRYEPLTPLTGEDEEWFKHDEDYYQNKRAGNVFKGADGKAYTIDGIIFREPNGSTYTSSESRVFIEFPYWPSSEIRDVPASECDDAGDVSGNTCEPVCDADLAVLDPSPVSVRNAAVCDDTVCGNACDGDACNCTRK